VSGTNAFSNSLHWESRYEIEWSTNVHSEVFVKSFSLVFSSFVKVDDLPFLVSLTMVAPYDNSLAFNISASSDIKYLVVLPIDELVVSILEDLPPSRVGTPDLHVSSFS
jgi:hypothetical protein